MISHSRIKVKVCGMTQPAQVRAAVDLGVDAIGMILHANSPRKISIAQAQAIRAEVPAFVSLVGVFVDCPKDQMEDIIGAIQLDLIQLHGDETNQFGLELNRPFIKAIRAHSKEQVLTQSKAFPDARALLLDPYVKGVHGGTGKVLESSLWPQSEQKLILAGGLSAANVRSAVDATHPYAVDINSGIEREPGVKDLDLLNQALIALGR